MTVRYQGYHVFDKLHANQLSGGGLHEMPGRTYYVNNITGSSSKNGRSWARAVAQVSDAVTLSEAYRESLAANNQWVRNKIVVQGTETHYEGLTAFPQTADILGLGTYNIGSWGSIAVINGGAADGMTHDARGLSLYNLHVESEGGVGFCALDAAILLGFYAEDCTFIAGSENAVSALTAAFRVTNIFAGSALINCRIGGTNGAKGCTEGMSLETSGVQNNNLVKGNVILAIENGIMIGTGVNDNGFVIDDNTIGGITAQLTGIGIQAGLYTLLSNNRISAATEISDAETWQKIANLAAGSDTPFDIND